MHQFIREELNKTRDVLQAALESTHLIETLENIAHQCTQALLANHKIFFAGNGGSAADSQHLAAELVGRLRFDRPGLAALALTTDTSALTAIANDYSFEAIFSRQLEALGQKNDVFIGITTSGKSANIVKAFQSARAKGIITIAFTGQKENNLKELCDFVLEIPSSDTQKVQECHIIMGHIVCGLIEKNIFSTPVPHVEKLT